MPGVSRTELYAAIRRDLRAGLSAREIQRTRHVTWRTVKAAESSAWPASAAYPDRGSKLDPFKPVIEEMLVADLDAPRKQRHTATRIFNRLVDEHHLTGVSYDTVRAYVRQRRPNVRAEHGRGEPDVFVPQTHLPGREGEIDFGEITVPLRGELVTWPPVLAAHVLQRQSRPPRVGHGRAGGLLRRARARLPGPRRGCPQTRSATTTSRLPSPK